MRVCKIAAVAAALAMSGTNLLGMTALGSQETASDSQETASGSFAAASEDQKAGEEAGEDSAGGRVYKKEIGRAHV